MKGPSAVWTLKLDVLAISPQRLVKCGEVEFGAAPVLVSISNEEFLVLSYMAPWLHSDV